jgi:hypothetical protein
MKKIHNNLNIEVTNQINNFASGIPLKELVSKDLHLLGYISGFLIFEGNQNKNLSEQSKNSLSNFLKNLSEFCNKKFETYLSDFVTKNSAELALKYLKIQDNLESNLQNSNNNNNNENLNQGIKKEIMNYITGEILNYINLNDMFGKSNTEGLKKERDEWMKLSENEITKEIQVKIESYALKNVSRFIVQNFIIKISNSMVLSFNKVLLNINDYLEERTGSSIQKMCTNIIKNSEFNKNK